MPRKKITIEEPEVKICSFEEGKEYLASKGVHLENLDKDMVNALLSLAATSKANDEKVKDPLLYFSLHDRLELTYEEILVKQNWIIIELLNKILHKGD